LQLIFPTSLGKHISTFIIYIQLPPIAYSFPIYVEKPHMLKAINNKLRTGREKVVHDHIIMVTKMGGNVFICVWRAGKFKFD